MEALNHHACGFGAQFAPAKLFFGLGKGRPAGLGLLPGLGLLAQVEIVGVARDALLGEERPGAGRALAGLDRKGLVGSQLGAGGLDVVGSQLAVKAGEELALVHPVARRDQAFGDAAFHAEGGVGRGGCLQLAGKPGSRLAGERGRHPSDGAHRAHGLA